MSNQLKAFLVAMLALTIVGSFFIGMACAATWQTANQITVYWDAVTTKSDGSPLTATDKVEYVIYLANAATDPNKANPAEIATVEELQYTITLNTEGRYFIGIRPVRSITEDGGATWQVVSQSEISWSDDPVYGADFGVRYFLPPGRAGGIRPTP